MQLRIRIGASADRSLTTGWQPAVEGARRAAAQIEAIGARQARTHAANTKRGADAEGREYAKAAKTIERWEKEKVRNAERSLSERTRLQERAAAAEIRTAERVARERARAERTAASAAAREQAKHEREAARTNAAIKRSGLSAGRDLLTLGGMGMRAAGKVGRAGLGLARDMAAGAGVDVSLQSIFAKNNDLEESAINLSNSGYMEGDARNGIRVAKGDLMKQAFSVGKDTGIDANVALEGLGKFTAKTGDLATGRDILKDMSVLSKATGASLEDMIDAAGDTANALGDTENKGAKISSLMRVFAGQGKLGAVEIKNLASQMAKLGAAAGTFGGGEEAIKQMGVLAQEARAKGGAATATQAATSVGSFANVFSKNARLNAFQHFGVQVHEANGSVRKPAELILDILKAASSQQHGGMKNFDKNVGQMVADVAARRSIKGFENRYKEAGGGEAGLAAVTARFQELERAAMADTEVMKSFDEAMKSSKSQAEIFNTQMREVALDAQTKLLPALQQLAPVAIKLGVALGDAAVKLTKLLGLGGNPDAPRTTETQNALTSTDTQLAGGKIADTQVTRNQALEADTRKAFEAAKADLAKAKADDSGSIGKMALRALDYVPSVAALNMAANVEGWGAKKLGFTAGAGTSFGHGIGEALADTGGQDVQAAQLRADKLEREMTDLRKSNEKIATLIESGLVIREMPPKGGGPPAPDDSGTSNTGAIP